MGFSEGGINCCEYLLRSGSKAGQEVFQEELSPPRASPEQLRQAQVCHSLNQTSILMDYLLMRIYHLRNRELKSDPPVFCCWIISVPLIFSLTKGIFLVFESTFITALHLSETLILGSRLPFNFY